MPVNQTEKTHGWVIGKLRESADPLSVQLMSTLNTMRVARNSADYGDDVADLVREAIAMGSACNRGLGFVAGLNKRYRKD